MVCPHCGSTDVTHLRSSADGDEYSCAACGQPFVVPHDAGAEGAPDEDIIDDAGDTDDGL